MAWREGVGDDERVDSRSVMAVCAVRHTITTAIRSYTHPNTMNCASVSPSSASSRVTEMYHTTVRMKPAGAGVG